VSLGARERIYMAEAVHARPFARALERFTCILENEYP
jgi:hypothetical protein